MNRIENNIKLEQLRSYSSVFSRNVFSNILSHSDYSQLDWLYDQYDSNTADEYSYIDYLAHIYKILAHSYRCEYIYKNEIINQLLLKEYGTKNTIAFNEFKVGNSIVDLAMMNGESKAFEIKTEFDTPRRLKKQMTDYRKIFNKCYLVVDSNECKYYAEHTEKETGIIALSYKKGRITIDEYRPASKIEIIESDILIKCLRIVEYENIVKTYFGTLPEVPSFQMFDYCKEKLSMIDPSSLNRLFLQEIKKRRSATNFIKSVPKELRQIILSLNLTSKNKEELISKLNIPINTCCPCTTRI